MSGTLGVVELASLLLFSVFEAAWLVRAGPVCFFVSAKRDA